MKRIAFAAVGGFLTGTLIYFAIALAIAGEPTDNEVVLGNRAMAEIQQNLKCAAETLRLMRELRAAQDELARLKAPAEPPK